MPEYRRVPRTVHVSRRRGKYIYWFRNNPGEIILDGKERHHPVSSSLSPAIKILPSRAPAAYVSPCKSQVGSAWDHVRRAKTNRKNYKGEMSLGGRLSCTR